MSAPAPWASYLRETWNAYYGPWRPRPPEDTWGALVERVFGVNEDRTYLVPRRSSLAAALRAEQDRAPEIDPENPSLVRFRDRGKRVSMKPGRYLKRFWPTLTPPILSSLTAAYDAAVGNLDVKFASTPDEIQDVYERGPHSCMQEHPEIAGLYGAGDLAVAYIEHGGITARVLCWPDRKIYGRAYGDVDRIERALQLRGFTRARQSHWDGARIIRRAYDGIIWCPYLDEFNVKDNGEFLIVGDGSSPGTNCMLNGFECEHCGEMFLGDPEDTECEGCSHQRSCTDCGCSCGHECDDCADCQCGGCGECGCEYCDVECDGCGCSCGYECDECGNCTDNELDGGNDGE